MKWILPLLFLTSCANVSTTRIEFIQTSGTGFIVELPKEVEAKDLRVSIDAKNGQATIAAATLESKNVETIKAQGKRENGKIEAVTTGAVKGAIKGVLP